MEKLSNQKFKTLEAKELVKIVGGSKVTQTLPTITVTPSGNQTDAPGSSNDGIDGVN